MFATVSRASRQVALKCTRNTAARCFSAVPVKFTDAERAAVLPSLSSSGWQYKTEASRDLIEKTFLFEDFTQAFAFMAETAFHAEAQAHHPEWFNVYNKVVVSLSTHDCAGFSNKDVVLAQTMDKIFSRYKK